MRLLAMQEQQRQFDINVGKSVAVGERQDRHDQAAATARALHDRRLLEQHAQNQAFDAWKDQQDFAQQNYLAQQSQEAQAQRGAESQAGIYDRMEYRDQADQADAMLKQGNKFISDMGRQNLTQQGKVKLARATGLMNSLTAQWDTTRPQGRIAAAQQALTKMQDLGIDQDITPDAPTAQQMITPKGQQTPDGLEGTGDLAITPDGTHYAHIVVRNGQPQLALTPIGQPQKEQYHGAIPGVTFGDLMKARSQATKEVRDEMRDENTSEDGLTQKSFTKEQREQMKVRVHDRVQEIVSSVGHSGAPSTTFVESGDGTREDPFVFTMEAGDADIAKIIKEADAGTVFFDPETKKHWVK